MKPLKHIEDGISAPSTETSWEPGKDSLVIDTNGGTIGADRLLDTASGGGRLGGASSKAVVKNALNASQRLKSNGASKAEEGEVLNPVENRNQTDRLDEIEDGAGVASSEVSSLLSWGCRACTYLNPEFVQVCLQCSTAKSSQNLSSTSSIKEEPTKKLWNDMKILKISDEAGGVRKPLIESTSSEILPASRIGSGTNNSPAPTIYPEGASKVITPVEPKNCNVNEQKWSCPLCTYDNWPRSVKCIMCGSSMPETENEASGYAGNNRANHAKAQMVKSKRYGREALYHREDVDALFLEACRGVVEGKIETVEEYLAAGGDPTRQLTETEVEILARPSAFDPGFTLVHLALR